MKYIGWDIGIKNLSYCILDDTFSILEWGIINLMDEQEQRECCILTTKGNQCDKKCFYIDTNDLDLEQNLSQNEDILRKSYCKTHGKKITNKVEIGLCFYCSKKVKFILSNDIHVCNTHSKNKDTKKKIPETNATKVGLEELGRNMIDKLDANPIFLDVSHVVIENQPVLKNPKMKSIQMILFTYFLIRKETIKLHLVSAGSKLKFNIKNEDTEKIEKLTNKYVKRKKLAVEYCKYFIKEDASKLDYFNNFSKRDDLADAYLLVRKFMIK
jgi:hypothetical protein